MKYIISYSIFFVFAINVVAQQGGYENLYHENGSNSAYDIKPTADGGYIMTGFSNPTYSFFGQDIMLFKIDGEGNFEWSMNYNPGGSSEYGHVVIETFNNEFAIVGRASSPITNSADGYFILTDEFGVIKNEWFIGDSQSNPLNDIAQLTLDSGFVACGKWGSNPYLVRTDKNGDTIFTKTYTEITGVFQAVTCSEDGQFLYLAGYKSGPTRGLILKTDLVGEIIWSYISDDVGFEELHNVFLYDGKLFSSGRAANLNEINPSDYHLRVLNEEDGETLILKRYDNSNSHVFRTILINEDSELLMVGTKSLGSGNGSCVYVIKTDIEGEIIWERHFGSNHSTNVLGWGICRAHDYGYMVCGQVVADGVPYVYIIKIDENGSTVGVNYIPIMPEISIYPNPCSEQLNISLGNHEGDKQLTIFNSAGQQVWQESTTAQELQINAVSQWQAGVYLVHIELVGHKIVRKIVVE